MANLPAVGWFLLSVFFLVFVSSVWAHPYHESLTEIEWNQERQVWEVAVRFLPEDLEDALEARVGRRVDLVATEQVDTLILQYINDHLQLRPVATAGADVSQSIAAQWVGKQVDHKAAWIYVEFHGPQPPVMLKNTLLFERNNQQINRVFHLINGRRVAMDFTAVHGAQSQTLDVDLFR